MAHSQTKRSNANTQNIQVSDISKSGFDLSHKTKDAIRVGRRELLTYEMVMSGDKFRLNTTHNLQCMPTIGSMTPAMDIRFEQVYIPLRSVNNDYEDSLSFDKGIAWNSAKYPKVIMEELITAFDNLSLLSYSPAEFASMSKQDILSRIAITCSTLDSYLTPYFLGDYASDLKKHLTAIAGDWDTLTSEAKVLASFRLAYACIADFLGTGSYLDKLNAPIITMSQLKAQYGYTNGQSISNDSDRFIDALHAVSEDTAHALPIDVMLLRCLYADWFETTRDANLEPARQLPRYKKLGMSNEDTNQVVFCYLAPRYAIFDKDIWTTAQIDSPYRTIVAPIMDENSSMKFAAVPEGGRDGLNIPQNGLISTNTPTIGNLGLAVNMGTTSAETLFAYGLDLEALRIAKLRKMWLMRGHVFGDEYADHILAQYGVKVSDARINKPELLHVTSKEFDINTEISNVTTSEMVAGSRTCTLNTDGETGSTEFFAEENGIVLTWCYIVPSVCYRPYEMRHLIATGKDFPQPILGNMAEELSFVCEIDREIFAGEQTPFGRHMSYHNWRSRVNEIHGDFHNDLQPYTFLRAFSTAPRLNAAFIHCHVDLPFMYDTDVLNRFAYGTFSHEFFVERELPIVSDVC